MLTNSLPGLDFGLGSELEMLRDTVRAFTQDKIAPRADEIDRSNSFPRELWPQLGALGLARHHGRRGVGRRGSRLSRPLRGDGGDFARLGGGRPVLRRALELCASISSAATAATSRSSAICRS